jgi:hypothetical protein
MCFSRRCPTKCLATAKRFSWWCIDKKTWQPLGVYYEDALRNAWWPLGVSQENALKKVW